MPQFDVQPLLQSTTVAVHDVGCRGACRHRSAEECATVTQLVFPYRGLYLRHVGSTQSVADANHVLFFNAGEGYRVSHPVAGGDASLSLAVSPSLLRELASAALLQRPDEPAFRHQALRIDERAQVLVALLRHSLRSGGIEPLEAESLVLTLVCRSLGPRTAHAPGATRARQRLEVASWHPIRGSMKAGDQGVLSSRRKIRIFFPCSHGFRYSSSVIESCSGFSSKGGI